MWQKKIKNIFLNYFSASDYFIDLLFCDFKHAIDKEYLNCVYLLLWLLKWRKSWTPRNYNYRFETIIFILNTRIVHDQKRRNKILRNMFQLKRN